MKGHAVRAMRQTLDAGVRWSYLQRNPAGREFVRVPPPSATEVRPFESWSEVDAVASAAGRDGPLIRFACATGLRPQEWQVLEWRDLDLVRRSCRVGRTLQNGCVASLGKTHTSLRTVALQRRAVDALAELPRPLDRGRLVFPSADGYIVNLSNFGRRIWHPALESTGLEHRPPYQTRHTYATLALSYAGVPLEWIAKQLGHRDTRVTMRHYARWLPVADERWLAALDACEDGARNVHMLAVSRREPE
jgi:integrase